MYHNVSTENQFLLSSTDQSGKGPEAASDPGPPPACPLDRDQLAEAFPEMLSGSQLLAQSFKRLDARDLFGIMVVRKDPAPSEKADTSALEIARALDSVCNGETGWWGIIEPDLFVCFFPNMNDLACQQAAERLQESLRDLTAATVSMGIASFPTAGFARDEILANAYKALDHAAFFGPGSRTVFDDVSLNISGDHLFQKGDITGAMAEFSTALDMEPANVNVRNSLGVCHSLLGQFDAAIEAFETVLRLAPEEFMAHYNLGLVHLLMEHHREALVHLLSASRLAGDVYEVALHTSQVYLELGEPEEALAHAQTAIRLKPTAHAYRLSADAYAALDRTEEAIGAYRQAVKQNPNDAAALSSLGLLYAGKGENAEIARIFCEKSVEIFPDEGKYRHQLGMLYFMRNQMDEALGAFQQAVDLGYDSTAYIDRIEALQRSSEDQAC
jgi:tetratricopeptide (TPR) repeat protein